jgi:catechol 2,3-dioxygenase-like lactoylglutathione lyase family enzyme
MIKRTAVVNVYVSDQEESLGFYTGALGFEKRRDNEYGPGLRWVEVAPPGDETRLVLIKPEDAGEPESRLGANGGLAFATDDIEGAYEELKGRGVRFDWEPTPRPWGAKDAGFRDPDGTRFLLVQEG